MKTEAILIAGPTASGKTALAVEIARRVNGEVVNADSMQVYDVLRILTARPSDREMAGVPHHLFGHADPAAPYSVAAWMEDVRVLLPGIRARGHVPVFVGGTGLYFKALLEGLSPVPPIDPAIREGLRARGEDETAAMHHELAALDAETAERLEPGDRQRVLRALEVVQSTGRSLSWWQAQSMGEKLADAAHCLCIVLEPDRKILHQRIAARFERMFEEGATDEVSRLLALGLDDAMPAMRAIGVREIAAACNGEISSSQAIEKAVIATRQYAKRQATWFRNQMGDEWLRASDPQAAVGFIETRIAASRNA